MIKRKQKTLKRIVTTVLLAIACVYLLFAMSSKNAVRMTMVFSGHPDSAMKCNPKRSSFFSEQMNSNIYEINYKYSYNHLGVKHIYLFKVHTLFIFHIATATYRYV